MTPEGPYWTTWCEKLFIPSLEKFEWSPRDTKPSTTNANSYALNDCIFHLWFEILNSKVLIFTIKDEVESVRRHKIKVQKGKGKSQRL